MKIIVCSWINLKLLYVFLQSLDILNWMNPCCSQGTLWPIQKSRVIALCFPWLVCFFWYCWPFYYYSISSLKKSDGTVFPLTCLLLFILLGITLSLLSFKKYLYALYMSNWLSNIYIFDCSSSLGNWLNIPKICNYAWLCTLKMFVVIMAINICISVISYIEYTRKSHDNLFNNSHT